MSNCKNCNNDLVFGSKFCVFCGAKNPPEIKWKYSICDNCNGKIPKHSKYCDICASKQESYVSEEIKISEGETKECPYCAEIIKSKAVICRFCNRELTNTNTAIQENDIVSAPKMIPITTELNTNKKSSFIETEDKDPYDDYSLKENEIIERSFEYIITNPVITKPENKVSFVLVLDISESMLNIYKNNRTIEELNKGLKFFHQEVSKDHYLVNSLEISIITFSDEIECIQEFSLVENFEMPVLKPRGRTKKLVSAVREAVKKVEQRKNWYKKTAQPYYKPNIILITDADNITSNKDFINLSNEIKNYLTIFSAVNIKGNEINILESTWKFTKKNTIFGFFQEYIKEYIQVYFIRESVKTETESSPPKPEIKEPNFIIVPKGFVSVEGGTFIMGDDSINAKKHEVTVSSFYIGKYQVTQEEYQAIMGENPSYFEGAALPVEQVSWFDAIKYCNAKSKKEGLPIAYNESSGELLDQYGHITSDITNVKGYRLPTEAEWEFAAKGGKKSVGNGLDRAYYEYAGSNNPNEVAWYDENSGVISYKEITKYKEVIKTRQVKGWFGMKTEEYVEQVPYKEKEKVEDYTKGSTKPVGTKKPNELGIYDMSGNVWERCTDWYSDEYYNNSTTINPVNTKSAFDRVNRGGGWYFRAVNLRVANRGDNIPTFGDGYLGFRLSRTP